MNFKEHAICGAIGGTIVGAVSYYFTKNHQTSIYLGSITLAGSLAPDIDNGSISSRIFAWIGIIVNILLIYLRMSYAAAIIGIIYMIFSSDKHRGITHKWILPFLCFIGSYLIKDFWLTALGLGFMIHYISDKIPPTELF